MLRCSDHSFYVGHTDDLERRFAEHQSGLVPGYTAVRLPVVLVWSETFQTRLDALEAEQKVKGWSRAKKKALIAGDWHRISVLARNRQGSVGPSRALAKRVNTPSNLGLA